MPNNFPTPEQKAVLDCQARIVIVRAGPGSGKTTVFAESIKKRLEAWTNNRTGLAALSFTNVAQRTIAKRVPTGIPTPHFVGTLDSFIFRFIVRPFYPLLKFTRQTPQLLPAHISDHKRLPDIQVGLDNRMRAPLFGAQFIGGTHEAPIFKVQSAGGMRTSPAPAYATAILEAKRRIWNKSGLVTHTDCHYLTSVLLNHPKNGAKICGLLARKFPVILIDELQDTGWFLSRAFLKLFESTKISGMLVGDPDQAIYGFSGATPSIFTDFEKLDGARSLVVSVSQRCSKSVSTIATSLSHTAKAVVPSPDAGQGAAILLVHKQKAVLWNASLSVQMVALAATGESLAILTRKGKTANEIKGTEIRQEFQGSSSSGKRIHAAVQFLLMGNPQEAASLVAGELAKLIFEEDHVTNEMLREANIDIRMWRRSVYKILMSAAKHVANETWNDWLLRQKTVLHKEALSLGLGEDVLLATFKKCNQKGTAVKELLIEVGREPLWPTLPTITTVHKVKGDEFDCVVFFLPKPHRKTSCPSVEWWSADPLIEEQRIAFVAASRAKNTFVLCLHETTHEALRESRPEFVKLFTKTMTLR